MRPFSEIPHGGATWPLGGGRVRASQGWRAFSAPGSPSEGTAAPARRGCLHTLPLPLLTASPTTPSRSS